MPTNLQLNGKELRILLIEDSEDDALLVERHLRHCGLVPQLLRVENERTMREALALNNVPGAPRDPAWDIILADYNLPAFSALEALRILKESGADLPFIVLSGAVSEEIAVAAMRAGAQDYVSKQNLARLAPAIERELVEASDRRSRLAAEAALRVSEQRFHNLVAAMPLGLLICDGAGSIVFANGAAQNLLKISDEAVRSCSHSLEGIFGNISNILLPAASGESARLPPAPFETECVTCEGATLSVLVAIVLLDPEGPAAKRQLAVFVVDLTEQKQSQEALRRTEKLAATGRLAASIAHEINNPLEAVTNCMYLLRESNLDAPARNYLDMAQLELNRVIQITTQTLRFYRQNTRPADADIHELLDTVLALYEARSRNYGITFDCEFAELPRIMVYDGEIRQVMANLVGNSVDAMQNTGGRLILRTALGRDWKRNCAGVVVTVADTGTGMDRYTAKRVFEPFFSTKGSTGTGLGLWVSREILTKHQGKIRVRSRQRSEWRKGGTVFRVFLPFLKESSMGRHPDLLSALA